MLIQGQKTVAEYTSDFLRLSSRKNLMETEGQQVARYIHGLKPMIRDKIDFQIILSLSEAQNMAQRDKLMCVWNSYETRRNFNESLNPNPKPNMESTSNSRKQAVEKEPATNQNNIIMQNQWKISVIDVESIDIDLTIVHNIAL